MEAAIVCKKCEICVNYWAHGYYEEPNEKLELYLWCTHPEYEENKFKRFINKIKLEIGCFVYKILFGESYSKDEKDL